MPIPEFLFIPSAFKHGIDEESMLNAIRSPLAVLRHPNADVRLVVGFDVYGNAIEVAYNYQKRMIFHAMKTKRISKNRSNR